MIKTAFLIICLFASTLSYSGNMGQSQMSEPVEGLNPFNLLKELIEPRNSELEVLLKEEKIIEALEFYNQAHQKNSQNNEQRNQYLDFNEELLLSISIKANKLVEHNLNLNTFLAQGETLKLSSLEDWEGVTTFLSESQTKENEYFKYKLFENNRFQSNLISQIMDNKDAIRGMLTEDVQKNFYSFYKRDPNFLDNYPLKMVDVESLAFNEEQIKNICAEPIEFINSFNNSFSNIMSYTDTEKLTQCIFAKKIDSSDGFEEFYANIMKSLDDGTLKSIPEEILTVVRISPNQKQDFSFNISDTDKFHARYDSFDKIDLINAKYKILIVPKKAIYQSKTTIRESKNSKYLLRTDRYPNPEYANAQNDLYNAQQDANRNAISDTMPKNYGYGAAGALAAILDVALDIGVSSSLSSAKSKLAGTPQYISRPVYENYQFNTSKVNTQKNFEADIYIMSDKNKILSTSFDKKTEENFQLAFNIHPQDSSTGYYNTQEDIDEFQKQEFSFELTSILNEAISSNKLKALDNYELMKSKVTSTNKTISLAQNKKAPYEIKVDDRFNNVVIVMAPDGSHGTGFYVAPNLVVTNNHVVEGSKFLEIKKYDGTMTFGKVEKVDIDRDLALIKVESNGTPVAFFNGHEFPLGSTVDAIGHPNGLNFSITRGVVSAIREMDLVGSGKKVTLIQTDTPINPGNSGGPLFFQKQVIGVNVMKQVAKDTEGLGFAIHLNEVVDFLYK